MRKIDTNLIRLYLGERGYQPKQLETPKLELDFPPLAVLGDPNAPALATILMVANPVRALGRATEERKLPKSGYYRCQVTRQGSELLWDLNCHHFVTGHDGPINAQTIGKLEATAQGHRMDAVLSGLAGGLEAWDDFQKGLPNGSQDVLIVGHLQGFGQEKTYQGQWGQGSVEKAFLTYAELYLMDRFLDRRQDRTVGSIADLAKQVQEGSVQAAADLLTQHQQAASGRKLSIG